jgi:hypothetical protein
MEDVRKFWPAVLESLRATKQVVPQQTSGPGGVKYNKFRLQCKKLGSDVYVNLGVPASSEEDAASMYASLVKSSDSQPRLFAVMDLMKNVAGCNWSAKTVLADAATSCRLKYEREQSER